MDGGKIAYSVVVDFADKRTRFKWSSQAVAAIDDYQSKAPAEASAMSIVKTPPQRPDQGARNGF